VAIRECLCFIRHIRHFCRWSIKRVPNHSSLGFLPPHLCVLVSNLFTILHAHPSLVIPRRSKCTGTKPSYYHH